MKQFTVPVNPNFLVGGGEKLTRCLDTRSLDNDNLLLPFSEAKFAENDPSATGPSVALLLRQRGPDLIRELVKTGFVSRKWQQASKWLKNFSDNSSEFFFPNV